MDEALTFDHLLTLARASEADASLGGWKSILDRLAEIDGLQLKQVVQAAKGTLEEINHEAIHSIIYQVVKKLGCRGEMERKLLMREEIPNHLIRSMHSHLHDALAQSLGLQALYPLAFDGPHRVQLEASGSLPLCLKAMSTHENVLLLQQHGCRFLQLMAFDDDCKSTILTHDGLPVVLAALEQFYTDRDLAISSSDLLYFLVADLDGDDPKVHGLTDKIVRVVVQIMSLHMTDSRVQSHGVAILNSLVANDEAKEFLCQNRVLQVVEHAIGSTDDATTDSIVLLFELLQDRESQVRLVQNACSMTEPFIISSIKAKFADLKLDNDDSDTTERLAYLKAVFDQIENEILNRQNTRLEKDSSVPSTSITRGQLHQTAPVAPLPKSSLTDSKKSELFMDMQSLHIESPSKFNTVETTMNLMAIANEIITDEDDTLHTVCAPKDELNSRCFQVQSDTAPPIHIAGSQHPLTKPTTSEETRGLPTELNANDSALLDAATKTIENERTKLRKVIYNYKLMKRRLAEQHKLLCVHNERSIADAEIHESILQRVQYLESALEEARTEWTKERSTRVELENEVSKGIVALAATQKALEDQRPPLIKERMVQEVKYLDAQRTIQQLTCDKLLLEEAVRTAQDLLYTCETNQFFLQVQIKEIKQEKIESLQMREEDIEIPKASKYFTCASPRAQRPQVYSPEPRTEPELTLELNDQQAIEAFLHRTYKCLETCSEGKGIHFSILRRYLIDSGVATPPVLPSDVDLILNKVLAFAQDNKLKEKRRKDYEFLSCPKRPNFGKLKFRYFSKNLFCEAITLIGSKKYPYIENTIFMLREIILNHLNPFTKSIESRNVQILVTSYDPFNFLKIILKYLHDIYYQPILTNENSDEKNYQILLKNPTTEPILQSMLEMISIMQREQKAIKIICDFYTSTPDATKDDALDLGLEAVVNFAVDFEVIPAFLDRMAVKRLFKDVLTYFKTFLAMYQGFPCPPDKRKYVAFYMTLGRLAVEIFKDKRDYDMPESQITGLLQWMDNSRGRGRIIRKGTVHAGIKFTNRLYAVK